MAAVANYKDPDSIRGEQGSLESVISDKRILALNLLILAIGVIGMIGMVHVHHMVPAGQSSMLGNVVNITAGSATAKITLAGAILSYVTVIGTIAYASISVLIMKRSQQAELKSVDPIEGKPHENTSPTTPLVKIEEEKKTPPPVVVHLDPYQQRAREADLAHFHETFLDTNWNEIPTTLRLPIRQSRSYRYLPYVFSAPAGKNQLLFATLEDSQKTVCSGWINQAEADKLLALLERLDIKSL